MRGFGATIGSGATDSIQTNLTANASQRSWACVYSRNGAGGGSSGRLWEKDSNGPRLFDNGSSLRLVYPFSTTNGVWTITRPAGTTDYSLVITYDDSSTANTPVFYADGASQSVTTVTTPVGTANPNTGNQYIGNNAGGTRNWDGEVAEFAVWDRLLSAAEAAGLGARYSPLSFPRSLVLCTDLVRAVKDRKDNTALTVTGTAVTDHPRIIYPQAIIFGVPAAAAGGSVPFYSGGNPMNQFQRGLGWS